jgi:hypothetical protein
MRFVIKRKSDASASLDQIGEARGIKIIDRIDDRAALIEAAEDDVAVLRAQTTGWTNKAETSFKQPGAPAPRAGWRLP